MSASEIIEQVPRLPSEEKRLLINQIWAEFGEELDGSDSELTPEQIAELDRRAEDALRNPGRGIPAEQLFAEIDESLRTKR